MKGGSNNYFIRYVSRVPSALWWIVLIAALVAVISGGVVYITKKHASNREEPIFRLSTNRDVSIGLQLLQGTWLKSTPQYWMYFKIDKDQYEWVVQFSETASLRYFSRGKIKIANDIMVLEQRGDLGFPVDRERLYINYMPITLRTMNVRLSLGNQSMMWEMEPLESRRIKGPVSMIFDPLKIQKILWVRP